jgi:branched-chain amino acid transport system ATP-binding protein
MNPLDIRKKVSIDVGGVAAVKGVDMEVRRGEIHGLIGPNRAGETTLFNLISGMYRVGSGEIGINNQPIQSHRVFERPIMGLSRTFQDVNIFGNMSVVGNVKVGFHSCSGFI